MNEGPSVQEGVLGQIDMLEVAVTVRVMSQSNSLQKLFSPSFCNFFIIFLLEIAVLQMLPVSITDKMLGADELIHILF